MAVGVRPCQSENRISSSIQLGSLLVRPRMAIHRIGVLTNYSSSLHSCNFLWVNNKPSGEEMCPRPSFYLNNEHDVRRNIVGQNQFDGVKIAPVEVVIEWLRFP